MPRITGEKIKYEDLKPGMLLHTYNDLSISTCCVIIVTTKNERFSRDTLTAYTFWVHINELTNDIIRKLVIHYMTTPKCVSNGTITNGVSTYMSRRTMELILQLPERKNLTEEKLRVFGR